MWNTNSSLGPIRSESPRGTQNQPIALKQAFGPQIRLPLALFTGVLLGFAFVRAGDLLARRLGGRSRSDR